MVSRFPSAGENVVGHREIARRLARQLLVNHAEEINKPRHLRRKSTTVGYAIVYELDPHSHRYRGQLESIQLERILSRYQSTLSCVSEFVPFSKGLDRSRDSRDAEFDAFQIALAAHEFQRIHGEFPGTLEQLVPTFIDAIPFDSTNPNGNPIGYRREENGQAIVWYCGFDDTDDDGDIDGDQPKDRGYRIRLNHKAWNQAGSTED